MVLSVWLNNLLAYSIQIAILAGAGFLLANLFRLKVPRAALIYWQVLLLTCIFVPAFQSWRHPANTFSSRMTFTVGRLGSDNGVTIPSKDKPAARFSPEIAAGVLATGA